MEVTPMFNFDPMNHLPFWIFTILSLTRGNDKSKFCQRFEKIRTFIHIYIMTSTNRIHDGLII